MKSVNLLVNMVIYDMENYSVQSQGEGAKIKANNSNNMVDMGCSLQGACECLLSGTCLACILGSTSIIHFNNSLFRIAFIHFNYNNN